MKKNFVRTLLILILFAVVIFCCYNLYIIYLEYKIADDAYQKLSNSFTKTNTEEDKGFNSSKNNTNNIIQENIGEGNKENVELFQENNYTFSKAIDFESLLSLNSDIIGWITIPGTVIDYPIVKSSDNDEYLHLTFLGEHNSSGSIFLDMRNNADLTDCNSIIYGHNMKNGSMFSELKNYKLENFYQEHAIIEIYTPEWESAYKIISCYQTTKTSDGYQIDFNDQSDYENWIKEITSRSECNVESYDIQKTTITLSTCSGASGSEKRMLVHIQKLY